LKADFIAASANYTPAYVLTGYPISGKPQNVQVS